MKVSAYICDYCDGLKPEVEIIGFYPTQDMFNPHRAYPSDLRHPERCPLHFCLDCYNTHVIIPVSNHTNRAKDEEGYKQYLGDATFTFKNFIIHRRKK